VALRGTRRFVPRLVQSGFGGDETGESQKPVPGDGAFQLEIERPGQLHHLRFVRCPRPELPAGSVEIEVQSAGLNFRDVLNGLGLYPGGPIPFGAECSGRIARLGEGVEGLSPGDEVVAVAPGSFGAFAVTHAALVAPRPAGITAEEAATLPIAFLTALYALEELARLRPGERVLIHAGAGGVGLAAIQVAQRVGVTVFATAGSDEKRAHLRALGVEHVMDSRTLEFADQIREITDGAGVDVVLNSLPGEFIPKSLACLGSFGRFVEIGRTDIYQNRQLGLLPFRNNLSYFAVDLDRVCRERPEQVGTLLKTLVDDVEQGALRPLTHTRFEASEIEDAFRYMARRRNIGKIVVDVEASRQSDARGPAPVRADATYLVTGGCGGVGLELAHWLVERGARCLVLVGRSGSGPDLDAALPVLRAQGARVEVRRTDVSDSEAVKALLASLRAELPPLRGVFHAAGVLDDGLVSAMSAEQMSRVLAPKVLGAWHLHVHAREDELEHFVLCSSVAAVLGSPGQGAYAAANAFLDALAERRAAEGLPATAVDFGPWADVGMAARAKLGPALESRGLRSLSPAAALDGLERALERGAVRSVVADVDWPRLVAAFGATRRPPLLDELAPEVEDSSEGHALATELLALDSEERSAHLVLCVQQELADVMGLAPDELDPSEPLGNLGLDSLMALELRERLELSLGIALAIEHLVEDPTISDIAGTLLAELNGVTS
jgi:NADPH:quinone reductase-like Zn-dependent oxidoreductase/aryl carrier-like protein